MAATLQQLSAMHFYTIWTNIYWAVITLPDIFFTVLSQLWRCRGVEMLGSRGCRRRWDAGGVKKLGCRNVGKPLQNSREVVAKSLKCPEYLGFEN